MNQEILDRIKKLLALATSSNEHEARAAAEKANELLVRHNLTMQDAKDISRDYDEQTVGVYRVLGLVEKMALVIVQNHFFVQGFIDRKRRNRYSPGSVTLSFIGEKTNVQVASYVYEFLVRQAPGMWNAYRKAHASTAKGAYFIGFRKGLGEQLTVKRKQVETGMALVLKRDPGVDRFVDQKHPGNTSQSLVNRVKSDAHAMISGHQAGKEFKISRGLGEGATANQKALTGGKA